MRNKNTDKKCGQCKRLEGKEELPDDLDGICIFHMVMKYNDSIACEYLKEK